MCIEEDIDKEHCSTNKNRSDIDKIHDALISQNLPREHREHNHQPVDSDKE